MQELGKRPSMGTIKQINYDIEEEEPDFASLYLVDNDESSSDDSEKDDNGGGGTTLIGGESIISVKELIDNNLTELLNTMKKFPEPTED